MRDKNENKNEKTIKHYRDKFPVSSSFAVVGLFVLEAPLWLTIPMAILIALIWLGAILSWRRYTNK